MLELPDLHLPDGVRLHVDVDGPDDAPVTVVLAHGWTLDSRSWAPVSRALSGPSARVVRYDHRGHGRSDAVDAASMTLDQLADDLAQVIAATASGGPLVLAGHSMGGMTLMALAERHPSIMTRVAGIALVATASGGLANTTFGLPPRLAPLLRRGEERIYGTRRWAARPAVGNARVLTPALRWLLLGPGADRAAVRVTATCVASCRPLTLSGFLPTLAAHERDAALAAFSAIPTIVLVGSRDRLTPVHAARRIADALPDAGLTVFPDAGHMLPVERVAGVTDRIAGLVRGAVTPPVAAPLTAPPVAAR